MPNDEFYAFAGEIVGDRNTLFGIGDVIAVRHHDFLSEDATCFIDIGNGLLGAVLELRAERCIGASDRRADSEPDGVALVFAAARQREPETECQAELDQLVHRSLHVQTGSGSGLPRLVCMPDSSCNCSPYHPISASDIGPRTRQRRKPARSLIQL